MIGTITTIYNNSNQNNPKSLNYGQQLNYSSVCPFYKNATIDIDTLTQILLTNQNNIIKFFLIK